MKLLKKILLGFFFSLALFVVAFFSWFYYVDIVAGNLSSTLYTEKNEIKTCYLAAYHIDGDKLEKAIGVPSSQIFFLFRGSVFYRVYDKDNQLLASTQWNFNEMSGMSDHAEWINNRLLLYPGNELERITVPECSINYKGRLDEFQKDFAFFLKRLTQPKIEHPKHP